MVSVRAAFSEEISFWGHCLERREAPWPLMLGGREGEGEREREGKDKNTRNSMISHKAHKDIIILDALYIPGLELTILLTSPPKY